MPSFNSQKCPCSHHRSLNHSVVKKLPIPSAQGRLADQAGTSCSSSPCPPLPFAIVSRDKSLGCTPAPREGRHFLILGNQREEKRKRWGEGCVSRVAYAGKIGQPTGERVEGPVVHEKSTHGTWAMGTWAGREEFALAVQETSEAASGIRDALPRAEARVKHRGWKGQSQHGWNLQCQDFVGTTEHGPIHSPTGWWMS